MSVPRTPTGEFLPPQFRFDSVPAAALRPGDRINWNYGGRANVCEVLKADGWPDGVLFLLRTGRGEMLTAYAKSDTTLNKVEVLR
jgi:hypothetical protein